MLNLILVDQFCICIRGDNNYNKRNYKLKLQIKIRHFHVGRIESASGQFLTHFIN